MEAESQIETELKDLLFKIGADEYVPIFAKKGVGMKQLTYMNDKQLSEVHIHMSYTYIGLDIFFDKFQSF